MSINLFFIRLSAVLAPSVIGVDTAAVKQLHLELTASSAHLAPTPLRKCKPQHWPRLLHSFYWQCCHNLLISICSSLWRAAEVDLSVSNFRHIMSFLIGDLWRTVSFHSSWEHSRGAGANHSLLTLSSFTTVCQKSDIYLYPDWLVWKKIMYKSKNSWKVDMIVSPHRRIVGKFKKLRNRNNHSALQVNCIFTLLRDTFAEKGDETLDTTKSHPPAGAPSQNVAPLRMTS